MSTPIGLMNEINPIDIIDGVVGAWNMEEALITDPILDHSGNNNNGTATNVIVVPSKFPGKNAKQFGVDSIIVIPHQTAINNLQPFSFHAFIYSTTLGNYRIIYTKEKDSGGSPYNTAFWHSDIIWVYRTMDATTAQYKTSTTFLQNTWHFISIIYDTNNTIHIFKNGVECSYSVSIQGSGSLTSDANNDYQFGNRKLLDNDYLGILGNVIYTNNITPIKNMINMANNYPNDSLEVGKVLCHRYATNTILKHGYIWEESQNNNLLTCQTHINMDSINN